MAACTSRDLLVYACICVPPPGCPCLCVRVCVSAHVQACVHAWACQGARLSMCHYLTSCVFVVRVPIFIRLPLVTYQYSQFSKQYTSMPPINHQWGSCDACLSRFHLHLRIRIPYTYTVYGYTLCIPYDDVLAYSGGTALGKPSPSRV